MTAVFKKIYKYMFFLQCTFFTSKFSFSSPAAAVHLHLPWDWHDCDTDTHSLGCDVFFFSLMMKTTKEPFKTQNYNEACHCECVCVCICMCVYPTWAECRHQAQTSSICPNSTAVYKAQTSNITTKLHSLIKTLFTVAVIIYPVTCALHKSKHQGMPMCVCVGWQKYTATAGPHVWRPALHTP